MISNKKVLKDIERYRKINNYITEQDETNDLPLPDEGDESTPEETGADITTDTDDSVGGEEIPEPVDVTNDPDVDVVGDDSNDLGENNETEELDITDLVSSQKDISEKQDEYMETMFSKLDDLTSKLGEMDNILNRINSLESKLEKYREKTPQEKLQLRSLDSYPYNQKLTDFFTDKQDEFEKTGKNEYVLTNDEVENFSDRDIKKSFDKPFEDEELV